MELPFIVTKFHSVFLAKDSLGHRITIRNRYSASFILTLRGRISFICGDRRVEANEHQAIFLPQGVDYVNQCTEQAESYVFNFHTLPAEKPLAPAIYPRPSEPFCTACYRAVCQAAAKPEGESLIFSEIYRLLYQMTSAQSGELQKSGSRTELLFASAARYLREHYADSDLQISQVAEHCYISTVYLQKLFIRYCGKSPHQMLTDIRMEQARRLLPEQRPLKEIAQAVGYHNLQQFCRAFKQYHGGITPTQSRNFPSESY